MIQEKIRQSILAALKKLGIEQEEFSVERPGNMSHGDYATNVAIVVFAKWRSEKKPIIKKSGFSSRDEVRDISRIIVLHEQFGNPYDFAKAIIEQVEQNKPDGVEKIEIAGPGFINFHLSRNIFSDGVSRIIDVRDDFGKDDTHAGKRIVIEHTQPNPFKAFHIGHLMNNAVGESLTRLLISSGADVMAVSYHGDVGLHVAKALWGMRELAHLGRSVDTPEQLGAAYALGAKAFEENENTKDQIEALNEKIYKRSDSEVNELYDKGRTLSLADFERMYARLGSSFAHHFFESEAGSVGSALVKAHLADGVFEESDGAIVFRGERVGLHTRVFITSQGLPTYETKDLGLIKLKRDLFPFDESIVITANEQSEYFKVVIAAAEILWPDLAGSLKHLSHGMLRLPSGKMSSRTGDVITAESLITDVKKRVLPKVGEDIADKNVLAEQVALGAIKYSILRQAIGKNIIFDFDRSLSFEGDSGPYLMYSYVRARSVLEKARTAGVAPNTALPPLETTPVERILIHFPNVVARAAGEYAPHHLLTYLTELASAWNTYYAVQKIVDASDTHSPYRVALADAVSVVLKNGLELLGIPVPEKM